MGERTGSYAAVVDPQPLLHEASVPWEDNWYRCPNTGEWVYRWADDRIIAVVRPNDGSVASGTLEGDSHG